jgi:hypothetical protein
MEKVDQEYKKWGGGQYSLPQPPRNRLKKFFLQAALRLGGPHLVGKILRLRRWSTRQKEATSRSVEMVAYEDLMASLTNEGG